MHRICETRCPERWCCATQAFQPPPVSASEIRRIAARTGRRDFHQDAGGRRALRVRENGYCVFFDDGTGACAVYPARPLDCRLFPFVCFGPGGRPGVWILWDCPYSRCLGPEDIETALTRFETLYAADISTLMTYDPDGYDLDGHDPANPGPWRIVREIKTFPPTAP